MPVVSNDRCFGFPQQKTVEFPQLQLVKFFEQVVDIPVVAQMEIPMVRFTMGFNSVLWSRGFTVAVFLRG